MKLEEVTSFPASPNQNPKSELERSIMTITNTKSSSPEVEGSVMTITDTRGASPDGTYREYSSPAVYQLSIEFEETLCIEYDKKGMLTLVESTTTPQKQDDQNGANSTPNQRKKLVRINGGKKGKGPGVMTVMNISEMFKNIAKNLPKDNPKALVNSPKRKSTFQNGGLDSPFKKNKFQTQNKFNSK